MTRVTKNLHSAGFSPPQHCLPLSAFPPFAFACCLLLCSPCLCYFTFYKKNLTQIPKYLKLFLIDAEYGFCPFPWCPIVPFLGSACLPVCAALLTFSHWQVLAKPSGIYIIQPCGLHPMWFSHTVSWQEPRVSCAHLLGLGEISWKLRNGVITLCLQMEGMEVNCLIPYFPLRQIIRGDMVPPTRIRN